MSNDPYRGQTSHGRQSRNRSSSRDTDTDLLYTRNTVSPGYRATTYNARRERSRNENSRIEKRQGQIQRRPVNSQGRPNRPDPSKKKNKNLLAPAFVILLLIGILILSVWGAITRKPDAAKTLPLPTYDKSNAVSSPAQTNELGLPSLFVGNDTALPLSGKVILLDPGHGGNDPGCVYPVNDPEYVEANVNLELALLTKAELEKLGACVILFRDDDEWLSLYSRAAMAHLYSLDYAKEMNMVPFTDDTTKQLTRSLQSVLSINDDSADSGGMGLMSGTGTGEDLKLLMEMEFSIQDILYVSIHCNANDDTSLHGTQVYYITDEIVIESETRLAEEDPAYFDRPSFPHRDAFYGRDEERNQILAQTIYDSVTAGIPELQTNAHQTVKENFAVLREHGLTGILIETGFFTNDEDRLMLTDPNVQQKIAFSIAQGCSNFFLEGN